MFKRRRQENPERSVIPRLFTCLMLSLAKPAGENFAGTLERMQGLLACCCASIAIIEVTGVCIDVYDT